MKNLPIFTYDETVEIMKQYILLKMSQHDMHGVRDAAAELEGLEKLEKFKQQITLDPKKTS